MIANSLYLMARNRWRPSYPSTAALLAACRDTQDPLGTRFVFLVFLLGSPNQFRRESVFDDRFEQVLQNLPQWKDQRFPPPRVTQSQASFFFVNVPTTTSYSIRSTIKLALRVELSVSCFILNVYPSCSAIVAVGIFPWLRGMSGVPFNHEDAVRG
jgi:hypothetical protein